MERIVLPLDGFKNFEEIDGLLCSIQKAETMAGERIIWGFKVNDALIEYGVDIVKRIKEEGFRVMADPKLFDIPNTNSNSISKMISAGADIITVHLSDRYIPYNRNELFKLAGITVLTSMDEKTCQEIYGKSIEEAVNQFAIFARDYSYNYIVCSARDLAFIPDMYNTKVITPAIRPDWYQGKDDQVRIMTPYEAIKAGSDLLVIGRPILQSEDRIKAIYDTNKEIEKAVSDFGE